MPNKWGISGPTNGRIDNPVGMTGLGGSLAVILTGVAAIIEGQEVAGGVAMVAGAVWALVSNYIRRQQPDNG